jgi:hypothetical protein
MPCSLAIPLPFNISNLGLKRKRAESEDNLDLVSYYEEEIGAKKRDKKEKEKFLEKVGKLT